MESRAAAMRDQFWVPELAGLCPRPARGIPLNPAIDRPIPCPMSHVGEQKPAILSRYADPRVYIFWWVRHKMLDATAQRAIS